MENKEAIKTAIDKAYSAQIKKLYDILSENMLAAKGDIDQIEDAKKKFKNGLELASKVKEAAISIADI